MSNLSHHSDNNMGHTDENQSRSLQSTSDPLVIEEPAQLELNEQTFLNRLVEFISTIKGINKEKTQNTIE